MLKCADWIMSYGPRRTEGPKKPRSPTAWFFAINCTLLHGYLRQRIRLGPHWNLSDSLFSCLSLAYYPLTGETLGPSPEAVYANKRDDVMRFQSWPSGSLDSSKRGPIAQAGLVWGEEDLNLLVSRFFGAKHMDACPSRKSDGPAI
jgi:hypothetical protein